jgi:uncharacterized protein YkwD
MQFLMLIIFSWTHAFFAPIENVHPLESFDASWKDARYISSNTASRVKYLKPIEKEVIQILNLVRQNPQHFNNTVVAKWPEYMNRPDLKQNRYYTSLVKTLAEMKPVGLLTPDSIAWISAKCHAITSGKEGYTGHDRLTKDCEQKEKFYGECCQYGYSEAVEILMSLLIDEDVPSLGHRVICLKGTYTAIGVSFEPHKEYGSNTVLDFTY